MEGRPKDPAKASTPVLQRLTPILQWLAPVLQWLTPALQRLMDVRPLVTVGELAGWFRLGLL